MKHILENICKMKKSEISFIIICFVTLISIIILEYNGFFGNKIEDTLFIITYIAGLFIIISKFICFIDKLDKEE